MNRHRPASSARRSRRRGFTLVEVLAALVLIGIVLPVAMRGVTIALMAAGKARHTGEAAELARAKLDELVLNPGNGYDNSGDFGTDWPLYRWQSRSAERDYGVTEVTVEVLWKTRGQDESLTLSTLAYPNALTVPDGTSSTATTPQPTGGP